MHNYTVGKIVCDCDFSLSKEKKQSISYGLDSSGNETVLYNENGDIIYEDSMDEEGNLIYKYKYETRFLLPDGTILENEEVYNLKKQQGEEVYIACFVGCIYHCG